MNRSAFLTALAWQLTLQGVPYVRPDLEAFVDDVWPIVEEDPDVGRWAKEFLQARGPVWAAARRELLASVHEALEQAQKTLQQSREVVEGCRAHIDSFGMK
jgi:hypothetical protein